MIEMLQETFDDKINIITPIEEESRGCQGEHFRLDKDNRKDFFFQYLLGSWVLIFQKFLKNWE